MTNENTIQMTNETEKEEHKVAYVIGNHLGTLTQLPNVYTLDQFFKALCLHSLPKHSLWIIGQGIHTAVKELLQSCAHFKDDLNIYVGSLHPCMAEQQTWEYDYPLFEHQKPEKKEEIKKYSLLEWKNFHFMDSTRVAADLHIAALSTNELLQHDFLWLAARELSESACQQALSNCHIVIRQAQLNRFLQLFPLPIKVETQFQFINDNKRSLKSLTRFYQDYCCAAEITLTFDIYSEQESQNLIHSLAEKTFLRYSENAEKDA